MEKKVSYSSAMAEIEKILAEINGDNVDIDKLAEKVKRAGELIKVCRGQLKKAEEDVKKALED